MEHFKKLSFYLFILLLISCKKEENYPSIEINATVQHVSEFGAQDGAVDLEVTGGVPPFSFLWSNNDTAKNLCNVAAGNYFVNVYDSRDQTATDTFEVTQPAPDSLVVVFNFSNPTETGAADGIIDVEIGGGYPPYTFLWNTGATTKNIEGLPAGTYVFTVTDNFGQVFTDSVKLTELLTDIDGNTYTIQKIGDQHWTGENLRVTHAPDGTPIESYVYKNDTAYEMKYGRLYTWDAAMNGSAEKGAQGICPCGWHIPTDEEFKQLEMHLGMTQAEADMINTWRGHPVGNLLKAGGNSGYNAQMSGKRSPGKVFSTMGTMEYIWTSTEYGNSSAWRRCLQKDDSRVGRWHTFSKSYSLSVRCVKDN
ncbi:MAG: FISUMP domain-containing protein [Tangfeifania sp.]